MDQQEATLEKNENLFTVLERGDSSIASAYPKSIILVGYTRAGKSTVFNFILNKKMTGKGTKKKSCFVLDQEDEDGAAELGNTFTSVTMDPNIHPCFDDKEQISLIDMAGFKDSRDYVGAIAVSYFLKSLFERVRKVKFVIVIPENYINEPNGQSIIKTFQGFINMFQFAGMNQNTKDEFKKSIAMVVTKATEETDQHENGLKEVLKNIKDPKFKKMKQGDKEIMTELLQHLISQNRIVSFESATPNKSPDDCRIIQELDEKDEQTRWDYFDLDQAEAKKSKPLISLPIETDFGQLTEVEQKKFKDVITKKLESYSNFGRILQVIDNAFTEGWRQYLQNLLEGEKPSIFSFDMSDLFNQIKDFVTENDVYKPRTDNIKDWKGDSEPLTPVQMLKNIIQLHNLVSDLCTNQQLIDSFGEFMDRFTQYFEKIIQILKKFTRSKEDIMLLCRLNYVLSRGFKEFKSLYKIKPDIIHGVSRLLPDQFNDAYDDCRQTLLENMVLPLAENPHLIKRIFKKIPLLLEYEEDIFRYYEQNLDTSKWREYPKMDPHTFFNEQISVLELSKADLYVEGKENAKALPYFIKALRNYYQLSQFVEASSGKSAQEIEEELDVLSMKKLKMLKVIVKILKELPGDEIFNPRQEALNLCQNGRLIDQAMEIFQLKVDSPYTTHIDKSIIYEDYANFCASWGFVQKGLELLRKKLALEEDSYHDHKRAVDLLRQMMSSKERLTKEAIKTYNDWKRLPVTDLLLEDILLQIQTGIPK